MDTSTAITLEAFTEETASYTSQQSGQILVRQVLVRNLSGAPVREACLRISADPAFLYPYETVVPYLPADKPYRISAPLPALSADYLSSLTDRQRAVMTFTLVKEEEVLGVCRREITLLPYDFWQGTGSRPELLAAYVQPGHPFVSRLLAGAASLLETWTGDGSLDAYQRNNPDRVLAQAGALYGAIQQENLVYAETPGAFYPDGQTVRLPETIREGGLANCLDLSLLYAAGLEAMGLHPLLVLFDDHAVCGFWLEEATMPDPCSEDAAWLSKQTADGVGRIALVEVTGALSGKAVSFDRAREAARDLLSGEKEPGLILDVTRARLSHISPLPVRVLKDGVWTFERPEREEEEITGEPEAGDSRIELTEEDMVSAPTRQTAWERRLLDLSLRNTLINLRPGRQILPLFVPDLEVLEDALASGSSFEIHQIPEDWHIPVSSLTLDNIHDLGEFRPMLERELSAGRLRSSASETDLPERVKHLYRTSRTMLEENGVGTLFLALGMLRWYESDLSEKARYAPILLLPAEIVRRMGGKGYVIRLREEEPQLNITIFEKIRQDFQIQITGLDSVPVSDPGVDVRRVLTLVRHAVMDKKRWDVMETACLGIFSFSQFVMWNDLHSRMGDLSANKLVRSLILGRADYETEDMDLPETVPEGDVYLPLPADATQLHAIRAAGEGVSFVLHGPPGTGKSQTITTMIANALGNGKTVLFVAEKMAALSVVQTRLERIGLGPFCLELHSNKATRRSVLDQLQEALDAGKAAAGEDYEALLSETEALRQTLGAYAGALHRRLSCGLSIHDLVSMYEREEGVSLLETGGRPLPEDAPSIREAQVLLERAAEAFARTGADPENPLLPVEARTYTQRMRFSASDRMKACLGTLQDLEEAEGAFAALLGLSGACGFAALQDHVRAASLYEDLAACPRAFILSPDPDRAVLDMRERERLLGEAGAKKTDLLEGWKEEFLSLDAPAWQRDLEEAGNSFFLVRALKMRGLRSRAAACCRGPVTEEVLRAGLAGLSALRDLEEKIRSLEEDHREALSSLAGRDALAEAQRSRDLVRALEDLTGKGEAARLLSEKEEAGACCASLTEAFRAYLACEQEARDLLSLRDDRDRDDWFGARRKTFEGVRDHADGLREWTLFMDALMICREKGLGPAADTLLSGQDPALLVPAYRRTISRQLIIEAVDESPDLSAFSGLLFNTLIERFSDLDARMQEVSAREIFLRLSAGIPDISRDVSGRTELGVLKRAIKSRGRGYSIRRLFEMLPNLLPRLCPCMLMSPLSAAQFLDPARPPFDLVIFDEASQLQTCKAVGALARGRNAVIVGDPNQMPPTTFFMTQISSEDDPDLEDLESILDDALTLGIPETHLLWHYRSRHESLIAFSNSRFYKSRLYTFPSVQNRVSRVSLVHVEGVYERSDRRRNRQEAEAVVAELVSRFRDPDRRKDSIGIVTFNISQQNLIDDLFSEACLSLEGLESWAYDREEPLFIKNLETVQGDERDVILFSVGFGPDKSGKIHMNFGPLNREGGWRRLNVAVSRARLEMKVFSSLRSSDIRVSAGMSRGAEELRAFLAYAEGEPLPVDASGTFPELEGDRENGILKALEKALKEEGYECDALVGRSGFRVDLGVIDPEKPGEYLLGVLLDGSSYKGARTVRDREIAQRQVLEGLGWDLIRVWTMDWWDDRDREIRRVLDAVREAEEEKREAEKLLAQRPLAAPSEETASGGDTDAAEDETEDTAPDAPDTPEADETAEAAAGEEETPVKETGPAGPLPYQKADLPVRILDPALVPTGIYDAALKDLVLSVVEAEAPITERLLVRRVLSLCSIPRTTARLRTCLHKICVVSQIPCRQEGEETVYWRMGQDPEGYREYRTPGDDRREIEEIPGAEIRAALCRTLFDLAGADRDSLIRDAARALGYPRMGEKLKKAFGDSLLACMEEGRIRFDGKGVYSLTEEETRALRG